MALLSLNRGADILLREGATVSVGIRGTQATPAVTTGSRDPVYVICQLSARRFSGVSEVRAGWLQTRRLDPRRF